MFDFDGNYQIFRNYRRAKMFIIFHLLVGKDVNWMLRSKFRDVPHRKNENKILN